MKKLSLLLFNLLLLTVVSAQDILTPEQLWKIGRLQPLGLSKNNENILFNVSTPDVAINSFQKKTYLISVNGGKATEIKNTNDLLINDKISSDGQYEIFTKEVQILKIQGKDKYSDLQKSDAYVFNSLNYRHWDRWEDGKFNHIFVKKKGSPDSLAIDIMVNEPYDSPQQPFGGSEDYIWHPNGKKIIYVTKKKFGTDYTVSTNTDLFEYDIIKKTTRNLTEDNKGYDIAPSYNSKGTLAWLQMKRDGYEADKQDIIVDNGFGKINLTGHRDDIHVNSFIWGKDDKTIYFLAPIKGTVQLFKVDDPGRTRKMPSIEQITNGNFDITGIIGEGSGRLFVTRTDMNRAAEIFSVNLFDKNMTQLSAVNDEFYSKIIPSKVESRMVKTTDGKDMLVWVIYPPHFDPSKKYPTLLYCQGGPQSALTQFYSFRWNFQLMASQGYIIVAPNRRGMPGFGTAWNEQVSKDWGGQVLQDYLSAIDDIAKEPYVDHKRLGCVGASFGGFSAFALAGIHEGRFKTFISHDGVYDFRSMYGTTDEMFFENWEKGGAYWDKDNKVAQRSFSQSPSNFVENWNTPILIIQGGKDYRVPIEQGLQAFQAAQLRGIKSRLVYLPEENHWVLSPQNAIVWQREFFNWLNETL